MDYENDSLSSLSTSAVVTAGGTISLGRRKYAVGLYWQPSPSGRVSQAAREAARQPGQMADFFAVRPGNQSGRVAQFGLGQKEFGHMAGLPTAAVSLAEEQPGSWGGVFKVPEGWWLVISRDDLIAPDGDLLYSDEALAKQRLLEEINLGGLQRVYAPDHWGFANSDPMPLALLMQSRAEAHLQNVHLPVRTYMIAAGVILGLCILGYLIFLWQQMREQQAQEDMARLSAEQKAITELQRTSQLAPPPPPPPPKRDWEDAPLPEIWLDACRAAFAKSPASFLGWKRDAVTCAGNALTVIWKRDAGYAVVPEGGTLAKDNKSVVLTYNFLDLPPRGGQTLGQNGDTNKRILNYNLPAEMNEIVDPVPPPVAPGQQMDVPQPPPPPWVKKKITIKSQTAPWYVWQSYISIPGLVVESVKWLDAEWVTEGKVYELR